MDMTDIHLACDKPGCQYTATGATRAQAINRMTRHWTANDHREFVDAILLGAPAATPAFGSPRAPLPDSRCLRDDFFPLLPTSSRPLPGRGEVTSSRPFSPLGGRGREEEVTTPIIESTSSRGRRG